MKTLSVASVSRLHVYEKCPRWAQFRYRDKLPGVQRENEAAARGERLHNEIEQYIRGELDSLGPETLAAEPYATPLRQMFDSGTVLVELMWYFNDLWETVPEPKSKDDWAKPIFLCKLDALIIDEATLSCFFYDWKSGKKEGNEVKHIDQLLIYCICVLFKYPDLDVAEGTLVYVDHPGEEVHLKVTRDELVKLFPRVHSRIEKMRSDDQFHAKPSLWHCMWCDYKTGPLGTKRMKDPPEGTGDCDLNP